MASNIRLLAAAAALMILLSGSTALAQGQPSGGIPITCGDTDLVVQFRGGAGAQENSPVGFVDGRPAVLFGRDLTYRLSDPDGNVIDEWQEFIRRAPRMPAKLLTTCDVNVSMPIEIPDGPTLTLDVWGTFVILFPERP